MIEPPVPIIFPNDDRWRPKLGPAAVSFLLRLMAQQDLAAIGRVVTKELKLPGRKELSGRVGDEKGDGGGEQLGLKHYRWINRAVAMEQLVSLLLSYLNRAERVRSFCVSDKGHPYYFAGAGKPDLLADYPASDDAPALRVLGEVSAKREITPPWHLAQLGQALRHAKTEQEKSPGSHIHAWVINAGDVGSDAVLRRQYQEFVKANGLLQADCSISVVPMPIADAAHALDLLCSNSPDEDRRFSSAGLDAALRTMADGLMAEVPPGGEGWMAEQFVQSVHDQGSLLPPAHEDDEDGPPGTR